MWPTQSGPHQSFAQNASKPECRVAMPVADGWTEFSLVQVAVLALSRQFIEFGCSVPSATSNACLLVLLESVVDHKTTAGLSVAAFLRLLSSSFAFVFFDEGIHKIRMKRGKRRPPVPEDLKSFPVLIIPVSEVVKLALAVPVSIRTTKWPAAICPSLKLS